MKPKFKHFTGAAFPALIIVPAMLQVAQALPPSNVITPDAAGNVVVNGNFDELNGSDWTVLASGGTTSPFTVEIKDGAVLTGSEERGYAVEVSAKPYTIDNFGSLSGSNSGIISRVSGTVINNHASGRIDGNFSGIEFQNEQFTVTSLLGVTGLDVAVTGTVVNDGSITGNTNGITANSGVDLTVENHLSGFITGNYGSGIVTGNNLLLTNDGTIRGGAGVFNTLNATRTVKVPFYGSGDGVIAGYDADITNYGSIIGANGDGVYTYDGLKLANSGTISGTSYQNNQGIAPRSFVVNKGSGVSTGSNAVIANQNGGVITGTYNGISAGSHLDLTNYGTISGTSPIVDPPVNVTTTRVVEYPELMAGYAGVEAENRANIQNFGTISGDQFGILIGSYYNPDSIEFSQNPQGMAILPSTTTTITNFGTISGGQAAISLGAGDNTVNLSYGSTVNGDIRAGEGNSALNFLFGSESINEPKNIVHGNVSGFETITKSEFGFAFIGGPGESFEVVTNTINISDGGLIINGNLSSLDEGKTQVHVIGAGQLEGTGNWNADITFGSGGISAGGTNTDLNGGDNVAPIPFAKAIAMAPANDSVGLLTINGNVNFGELIIEPRGAQLSSMAAPVQPSTYIRVDINPQTQIINGVNSDLILHTGYGNTFDVAGMGIRLAPTNINKTLTEGTYTIIDSENPLIGVDAIGPVGLHFTTSSKDTGPFKATGSGENDTHTVLTQYFTTVGTEDPVEIMTKASKNFAPAVVPLNPNNSNLVINIQHGYANLPGLNSNQAALGAAIDSLVNSPNPLIQDFIAALDYSDLATVQATLATLDPGATLGVANSVVNSNYRLHRLTQEHLAQIRGNGREYTDTAPSSKDAKGVITQGQSTVHSTGRGNAWGSFSYDHQDNNGAAGNADYDGNVGAFTAGVDYLIAPQLVVGIVLDGSKSSFDADGFSSDVDSFRGAVYGTWGGSMGFYSDALVGFGSHSLDSTLGSSGILRGRTSNDTDATSFQAMWTAGYNMGDAKVKHGPFAGLEYQKVDVDGYTQGGPLAIKVDDFDVESFRALIGYRVNFDLGKFRPYASVAYAHEFEDGANHATATLGGAKFRVSGAEQSSAFIITAGTDYSLTDTLLLNVGYRGEIATDDGISSNGGSIGLNYSF